MSACLRPLLEGFEAGWPHDVVWTCPQSIKQRFDSASFVGRNRVVFNIKGNDYRLIVAVACRFQAVYFEFIGTHVANDRMDAAILEDA